MSEVHFTRDAVLEMRAFEAGWEIERIKRCMLSDLRSMFPSKMDEEVVNSVVQYDNEVSNTFKIDESNEFIGKTNPRVIHIQYPKSKVETDSNSDIDTVDITCPFSQQNYTGTNDILGISQRKKTLEAELKSLNDKEISVKNHMDNNLHIVEDFNLKEVYKLKDAQARIHTHFEMLCSGYKKSNTDLSRKIELISDISEEYEDEEEIYLIRQSVNNGERRVRVFQNKLTELCFNLESIIKRKLRLIDILEDVENTHTMLVIRDKLGKMNVLLSMMKHKSQELISMYTARLNASEKK